MLLALVAGCGDSRLSHADYVKRADAICAAYADATKPVARPRSYTEIVAFVRKTLPLYEAALRRLKVLRPPSADAATVDLWLAADRRVAKAVRSLGEAAERRDFPSVTAAASQAQLAGSDSRRSATALGMNVCARLSSDR
jgi:hypothetical protein